MDAIFKLKKINTNIKMDYITGLFVLMFLSEFLQQVLGVSSLVYFVIDIPISILFFISMKQKLQQISTCRLTSYLILLIALFVSACVGALSQKIEVINLLYGIYKFFRCMIFFLTCITYINYQNTVRTMSLLKNIFWLNTIVTLIQFFFLHINQDLLGGIFGTTAGVNQYTNLFFTLCSVYIVSSYFCEKITFNNAALYTGFMLLISALAEIKFFFFEFLIICCVCFMAAKKNAKTYIKIVTLIFVTIIFYEILILLFPEFRNLVSELFKGGIKRLIDLQRHYSTETDIGRGRAFSEISKRYLTTIWKKIWGIGIGNATSFSLADNTFFITNMDTHYDSFLISYLFLEQGIVGTCLYIALFTILGCKGIKFLFRDDDKQFGMIVLLLSMCAILLYVYNMSMYGQFSFLIYWGIAATIKLRFIKKEKNKKIM